MDEIWNIPEIRATLFPPSIRPAPYEGVIEGGEWIAIPNCTGDPLDSEIYAPMWGDIVEASEWWSKEENVLVVGVGSCPDEAFIDLINKTYYNDDPEEETEGWSETDIQELAQVAQEAENEAIDDIFTMLSLQINAMEQMEDPEQVALMNLLEMLDVIEEEWEQKGFTTPFQMFAPPFLVFAVRCLEDVGAALGKTPREVLESMSKARGSHQP